MKKVNEGPKEAVFLTHRIMELEQRLTDLQQQIDFLHDQMQTREQRVAELETHVKTMLGWAQWLDDCDSYYARKDDDGRQFNADVAAAVGALTLPPPAPIQYFRQ